MWSDSDVESKPETGGLGTLSRADAVQQEFPNQEVVDYYLAKASGMRARQLGRAISRGWKAVRRFVRRQLSPCMRVKLPPDTA